MLSRGFDRAFRSLVGAFKHYHDVPRSPHNVVELGQARINLDEKRDAIRKVRPAMAHMVRIRPILKADISEHDYARLRIRSINDSASRS